MIEKSVGACLIAQHKEGDKVKSPGVKYRHYRPKCDTALFTEEEIDKAIDLYNQCVEQNKTPYIMCRSGIASNFNGKNILDLGETPEQIAYNLYDKLLEGETKAQIIIAISMPSEQGVYMGIMNRLRKSCG
jgi:L-threonylcarbamoyladenylate synthase